MTASLALVQLLNGVQLGMLLFLMAAGLTLVFGIMGFVNLAHGSLYMVGAYVAAVVFARSDSFVLALLASLGGLFLIGLLVDRLGLARLHQRDHLDQVLATFGIVMFCNEAVRVIWGPSPLFMDVPSALGESVQLLGIGYPVYRLAIIAAGLLVAVGLYLLIERTRLGMLIRAGASNRPMVAALGARIDRLNAFVFALGAAFAGMAGALAGPILSIQPGMGEPVLILTLVVIVIGGVGSVRGAFLGALVVGIVDTAGRTLLPGLLRASLPADAAASLGPALASMLVYVLMALILAFKPDGLFPLRRT